MRKTILSVLIIVCVLTIGSVAFGDSDIKEFPFCKHCGMDRDQLAHSRMVVVYDDGSSVGTCSIHCVAIELILDIDKTPRSLQVGDYNSKKRIDAEKAFWVVGGKKPGVMTIKAKWAFKNKADAKKFIAKNGGSLSTFDEVMKVAYEDMYVDTKMILEKRKQ
ncbi:MAG: nitrous oxide reductase accessory protein NosL [Pseudomonadota bacterium]